MHNFVSDDCDCTEKYQINTIHYVAILVPPKDFLKSKYILTIWLKLASP